MSGGKIIGTKDVTERMPFDPREGCAEVISTVYALHSTKGWRILGRERGRTKFKILPARVETFTREYHRRANKPHRELAQLTEPAMQKAIERHGWYRRKQRNGVMSRQLNGATV